MNILLLLAVECFIHSKQNLNDKNKKYYCKNTLLSLYV